MKIISFFVLFVALSAHSQELKTEIGQIKSLIKSSKVGYENSYLIIAKTNSLTETIDGVDHDLLQSGASIEFLLNKSVCYDEVRVALSSGKMFKLHISNLKKVLFKIVNKPDYQAFLKADIIQSSATSSASCKLTLL